MENVKKSVEVSGLDRRSLRHERRSLVRTEAMMPGKSSAFLRASMRRLKRIEAIEPKMSASKEEFQRVIREIMNNPKEFEDWKDHSENPSYSKFKVPYFMQCRDRYKAARDAYEKQFQREISLLLENNTSAYEVARATRHLSITTLWPPLHNRREILYTQRYFFRLKPQQQSRLNYIMTHDFN